MNFLSRLAYSVQIIGRRVPVMATGDMFAFLRICAQLGCWAFSARLVRAVRYLSRALRVGKGGGWTVLCVVY